MYEREHDDDESVEQASRLAVTAVVADLEYWARTVVVDGAVEFDALLRVLDTVRDASVPADSLSDSIFGASLAAHA